MNGPVLRSMEGRVLAAESAAMVFAVTPTCVPDPLSPCPAGQTGVQIEGIPVCMSGLPTVEMCPDGRKGVVVAGQELCPLP